MNGIEAVRTKQSIKSNYLIQIESFSLVIRYWYKRKDKYNG